MTPLAPRQRPLFFRGNSRSESAPISENSWRFGAVLTPSGPRELGQPLGGAGCPVLPAGHTEPPQIASESRILATFCASLSTSNHNTHGAIGDIDPVEQIAVLVGDWDHVTHIGGLHVSDPSRSSTLQQRFSSAFRQPGS